jgi:3'-5' exoribonuclease
MSAKDPTKFEILASRANQHNARHVWDELIYRYPQFEFWSGSHQECYHHYGKGGLVRHTLEVVELGLHTIPTLDLCGKVDSIEYFLAALFHDTGKMFDYTTDDKFKAFESAPHKRYIHHISRSALIWHDVASKFSEINDRYHDSVLHAILAHHGLREYGSPVAPKTRVAWLLHLCDGISARMDDAETLDVVHKKS